MEQTARAEGEATHLRLVEEPGLDQKIEALVDALWHRGALLLPELAAELGWESPVVEEVLRESEALGVVRRMPIDPHDIVDLA